jgi:hypothetical protein
MKKRLSDIFEALRLEKLKKDQRIIIFSVCLLIATIFWFLNALSKNYTTTLSYPVKYINPPKDQFLVSDPPSKLELKVEAYGFTLLRHKLAFSFSPVIMDLTYIKQNTANSGNILSIRTDDLKSKISDQVSKEITITDISPKILTLTFDSLKTKMVPVKPNAIVTTEHQFYITDSIAVNPQKIEVKGPSAILDTIQFIETKFLKFSEVSSAIERVVKVEHPENTILSDDKVTLTIHVERFTEKKIEIPLKVKTEKYEGQVKLFPSKVTVTFMVSLSEFENITESDFEAYVDLDSVNSDLDNLKVIISSKPRNIKILRITPDSVEFLIETNSNTTE